MKQPTLSLMVLLVASACWPAHAQQRSSSSSPPIKPVTNDAYLKWLNEDVIYIITLEERRAFERLSTDGEREQFIEAFWRRRDTDSNTQQNEFRKEHYRRIAYANAAFTCNLPGWKTDRGRIYITLGWPDEIQSVPLDEGKVSYPRQLWIYRRELGREWIYEFVDDAGTGCYPGGRPTSR